MDNLVFKKSTRLVQELIINRILNIIPKSFTEISILWILGNENFGLNDQADRAARKTNYLPHQIFFFLRHILRKY